MNTIKGTLVPLRNMVFVKNLESGARKSAGGIFILADEMKDVGIRSRWGQVHLVGPEVTDIKPGEWILIKHGRWTFNIEIEDSQGEVTKMWRVDYPEGVDLVSDVFPSELTPIN